MTATGLPTISTPPTNQSRAFLRTPGTPWAYSGLQITRAAWSRISARQRSIEAGGPASSMSGLKNGNESRGSRKVNFKSEDAMRGRARKSLPLDEPARRRPEMPRTLTVSPEHTRRLLDERKLERFQAAGNARPSEPRELTRRVQRDPEVDTVADYFSRRTSPASSE